MQQPRRHNAIAYGAGAIGVAVCAASGADRLAETLRSVLAQDWPAGGGEVLVVPYGGDVPPLGGDLRVRVLPAAGGLVAAVQSALAQAATPVLAFIAEGATAQPGWLHSLHAAFGALGHYTAAVGGPVRADWPHPRPGWLGDSLLHWLGLNDLGGDVRWLGDGELISRGNLAVRVDVLDDIADLDQAGDPLDLLAVRVRAAEGRCGYAPDAAVRVPLSPARLTQGWFRQAAARRAVRDCDAARPDNDALAKRWHSVLAYLRNCPPADRSLRALFVPQADAACFSQQLAAVYDSTCCLLGAEAEIEPWMTRGV